MIAAIERGTQLCIVQYTRRVGLQAKGLTYCRVDENAGEGVYQVPDGVFAVDKLQRVVWTSLVTGKPLTPCPICMMKLQQLQAQR